ncbi:MAG TPA: hypothetical protein VM802_10890 [Chitinophaga sp.]|uniref:hypothetical protein n=1 Tax=Chitinophaga sp. TaxID=1869181 RepID=UPI002BCCE2C1|nr:hypothetical protein [Chitinophaga sp.]HVI45371.1 hypothetical protein [Chitinophaga sp.]
MKAIILTTLSIAIMTTACRQAADKTHTRIVYDAGARRVITHAVNKKLETMSILYGNASAYNTALAGNGLHQANELYTFVTWRYHENPLWYGSKVNGELLSVEHLRIISPDDAPAQMDYQVESGEVLPVNGRLLSREERIRYLLEYHPSIMP